MRISTAYFAGIGTVAIAIAAGLGGGYLAANVVAPHEPKYGTETSRLERRMSSQPIPVTTAPSEPVRYIAGATEAAAKPAAALAQTEPPTPAPQTTARADQQTAAASAEEKTVANSAATQPAPTVPSLANPAEQAGEKTATPPEAFAKARDVDIKRAAAERRRAERRQQWADKRRFKQPREQELEAVEERVREVTEPRRIRVRQESEPRDMFAAGPARSEMPRIRLFDQE